MKNYDDLFETQENAGTDSSSAPSVFNAEEYKARKQAERSSVYDRLDSALARIKTSGDLFMTYLRVQTRFDRYSVNNALLIADQAPDAVGPLKSFDEWKTEHVYIKRGEEAICILEPGREYTRDDGSHAASFNVKKVFARSQTDSLIQGSPSIIRDERLLLKSIITHAPCQMKISDQLPEEYNAFYSPKEETVFVRPGMEAADIFRALTAELAHAYLHKDHGENYDRSAGNRIAYPVSFMLSLRYGVPTDAFSFDPKPEEFAEMSNQDFRAVLSDIRNIAGEIEKNMNRVLEANAREPAERRDEER